MTRAPQKASSQVQRAAHALRELIFSGDLPAGSDHLETELAARLGMSRTPVREAALVLEGQGLLEVRPRKGVRILAVSAEDMREVYEVLTALESLAAERAARAGHPAVALQAMETSIEEMDAALAQDDLERWAKADDAFHRALVGLGGNARIEEIAERMSDQVRRARMITLHMRPKPVQSNADHRAVFDAIRQGDAGTAREVHRQHRTQAKDMLVALLRRSGMRRV